MDRPNERDRVPDAPPRPIATSANVTRSDNGGWVVAICGGPDGERQYVCLALAQVHEILDAVEWISRKEGERLDEQDKQRRFVEGIQRGLPEGMRFGGMSGPFA